MADVAQWTERLAVAQEAMGSNPIIRPLVVFFNYHPAGGSTCNIRLIEGCASNGPERRGYLAQT